MRLRCHGAAASAASGSAWIQVGRTQVVCGVYGPREQQTGRAAFSADGTLTCELSFAPFAAAPGARKERDALRAERQDLSAAVRRALEPSVQLHRFPKSVLDVFVLVLQDDGSVLPAAVTCAAAALAAAGVELYDVAAGCASAQLPGGAVVLDPDAAQEAEAEALWNVALLPASGNLSDVALCGRTGFDAGGVAVAAALRGCLQRHQLVRERLLAEHRAQQRELERCGAVAAVHLYKF